MSVDCIGVSMQQRRQEVVLYRYNTILHGLLSSAHHRKKTVVVGVTWVSSFVRDVLRDAGLCSLVA